MQLSLRLEVEASCLRAEAFCHELLKQLLPSSEASLDQNNLTSPPAEAKALSARDASATSVASGRACSHRMELRAASHPMERSATSATLLLQQLLAAASTGQSTLRLFFFAPVQTGYTVRYESVFQRLILSTASKHNKSGLNYTSFHSNMQIDRKQESTYTFFKMNKKTSLLI